MITAMATATKPPWKNLVTLEIKKKPSKTPKKTSINVATIFDVPFCSK